MESPNGIPISQNPNPKTFSSNPVAQARERLQAVEKVLNSLIIGHEEMVKATLVGIVAGEHVVLIGAPGTAKSYMVHSLAKLINARYYRYLLTKFTDYSELFGPIDITALAQGKYVRRWSDIISADIIFLDEIFKANSAILNALLSLLQERIIYDSMTGEAKEVALWTAIGASNEVPSEEELMALYDRFSIKVFVDYLSNDLDILRALEARWLGQAQNHIEIKPVASMDDVKTLHQYALSLIVNPISKLNAPLYKVYHVNVVPMIKSLRAKGVLVSDRTIIEKLPKIYAAYLALYGVSVDNIMNAPFDILRWMAKDRSQLADIQKAIDDALGEVAELSKKLEEAKRMARSYNLQGAKKLLEEILSYDISRLTDKPWLKPRIEAVMMMARKYLEIIEKAMREVQFEENSQ